MSRSPTISIVPPWELTYAVYAALIYTGAFLAGVSMDALQGSLSLTSHLTQPGVALHATAPVGAVGRFLSLDVHNSSIVIASWLSGVTAIGPVFILWQNGMVLANYVYRALTAGSLHKLVFRLVFLVPHGVFELSGVFLGTGAALYLAKAALGNVFGLGHHVDLIRAVIQTIPVLVVSLGLLVVAAFVEADLSVPIAHAVANTIAP